jgi:flagellar protein FliO/FliZ
MDTYLGPLLSLVFIVGLIPLALWLVRRTPMGGAGSARGGRTVGVLPLSNSQRVVTVEVGLGSERRWLVLGVTPSNISTLHVMAPQDDAAPGAANAAGAPAFGELLGRLRGRAAATGEPGAR